MARVPVIQDFVSKKARNYETEKDKEVDSCVICLEEFNDQSQVAELNCSNKHIFHVNCLQEWVAKYDVCPMCREKVMKD